VQAAPCTWRREARVSWLSLKIKVGGFLRFDLKTGCDSFFQFGPSKPVAQVFQFGPQNRQLWFGDLGLKITATVSWFVPQNQAGFGLLVASQNQWREDGARHTSRSGGLLHLEARHARVSHSDLKTGGCATVGGARDTITKVTSGSS
jgi:hypothetical protein